MGAVVQAELEVQEAYFVKYHLSKNEVGEAIAFCFPPSFLHCLEKAIAYYTASGAHSLQDWGTRHD
jgi:hypothetical protein